MFINPKKILDKLELSNNLIAADFGCGSGGFSIPLANILKKGKVYAIDVQKEALSSLLSHSNVSNIKVIHCDIERGVKIKDNEVDIVILANILHQAEDKKKIISEAKRVLKEDGVILIVDWIKGLASVDKQEILDLDLKLKEEIEVGEDHFALVFNK